MAAVTIRFRNEAKRHLMATARRYGWRGKTYGGAVAFARRHKAKPLTHAWGLVKSARNLRRRK